MVSADNVRVETFDRPRDREAGSDCSLGVVFMSLWIAKVHQYPVPHVPGDEACELRDFLLAGVLERGDHLSQVFGIEL